MSRKSSKEYCFVTSSQVEDQKYGHSNNVRLNMEADWWVWTVACGRMSIINITQTSKHGNKNSSGVHFPIQFPWISNDSLRLIFTLWDFEILINLSVKITVFLGCDTVKSGKKFTYFSEETTAYFLWVVEDQLCFVSRGSEFRYRPEYRQFWLNFFFILVPFSCWELPGMAPK